MKPPGCEPDGFCYFEITTTRSPATTTRAMTDPMDMLPSPETVKAPTRRRPANRRRIASFSLEHEGHEYRATASWFEDGRLAEIFLQAPGKMGTPLQSNADTAAILVSLLLQHGVDPEIIRHSVTGPIAIALQKFMGESA